MWVAGGYNPSSPQNVFVNFNIILVIVLARHLVLANVTFQLFLTVDSQGWEFFFVLVSKNSHTYVIL